MNVSYFHPFINHTEIDLVNSHNETWTAGVNSFMLDKSMEDVQHLCGTRLDDYNFLDVNTVSVSYEDMYSDVEIPASFDVRNKWPTSIHPIRNQKHCGSCWAFSAAEVLSDRFSIASNGRIQTVLSPEDLVSCDKSNMGCQGGQLAAAWEYMKDTGIVSDACFPYTSGNGTTAECVTKCSDSESFMKSKHKAKNYYRLASVEDIQREILLHGPVQTGFRVYKSFMSYTSGVYQRNWWKFWDPIMGGHAVKIVGWGTYTDEDKPLSKPVDYWTVANSWDTTWGEEGYFKIKKGVNMCGIESGVYAGLPDIEQEQEQEQEQ